MSTEENKALVCCVFEELDKKNFDLLDELCAPDFAGHFPGTPQPITLEELKQVAASEYAAFPDYYHTIEDIIAEGDKVAVRLTNRGTHTGEFMGIPPTGKKIEYGALFFGRVTNGKVAEVWVVEDNLGMMQQIGMELKLKKAEE